MAYPWLICPPPIPFLPCKGLHRCVWHYATRIGELKDISVFPGGEYSLFSPGLSAAIPRVLNNPFFVSDRNHQNLATGGFLSETMRCVMGFRGYRCAQPTATRGTIPCGECARMAVGCVILASGCKKTGCSEKRYTLSVSF